MVYPGQASVRCWSSLGRPFGHDHVGGHNSVVLVFDQLFLSGELFGSITHVSVCLAVVTPVVDVLDVGRRRRDQESARAQASWRERGRST